MVEERPPHCTSTDLESAAAIAKLTKTDDTVTEFMKQQNKLDSVSMLFKTNESLGGISHLMKSGESQNSRYRLRSAEKLNLQSSMLLSGLPDHLNSKDWGPLDGAKMDEKAKLLRSQSGASSVDLGGGMDWNSFFNQGLPPASSTSTTTNTRKRRQVPITTKENHESEDEEEEYKERPKQAKRPSRSRRSLEPEVKEYVEPTEHDVLFGRGGRSNHHKGNKRYHDIKLIVQPRYMAANKEEKTAIAQELVDEVQSNGARFLKPEGDQWFVVSNLMARRKVSQALREINTEEVRKKKRAKYGN